MTEETMTILFIIYAIVGYWAAGVVFYNNKFVVQTMLGQLFMTKLVIGILLGIVIIPVAIIKRIFL